MGEENKPLTITWGALNSSHILMLGGMPDDELEDEPEGITPFRVPDPEAGGGWAAVLLTETVAPPSVHGPWRNYGGEFGPERVLWVNGRGEWGYSVHHLNGSGDLLDMEGSLKALRKSIRPVREIEGFEMMPEEYLERALGSNVEDSWPLERLAALARGDFEVDNPAMKYWK